MYLYLSTAAVSLHGMFILLTFIFYYSNETGFRGIIGPILVRQGLAFGTNPYKDPDSEYHEHWKDLVNYTTLRSQFTSKDHPSVRYWLVWPGVLAMIAISFTGMRRDRTFKCHRKLI